MFELADIVKKYVDQYNKSHTPPKYLDLKYKNYKSIAKIIMDTAKQQTGSNDMDVVMKTARTLAQNPDPYIDIFRKNQIQMQQQQTNQSSNSNQRKIIGGNFTTYSDNDGYPDTAFGESDTGYQNGTANNTLYPTSKSTYTNKINYDTNTNSRLFY